MSKSKRERASILGIRLPEIVRNKIRRAAEIEGRSESGFARFHTVKAADQIISNAKIEKP